MGTKAPRIQPTLTDSQWRRMLRYGVPVRAEAGDVLFRSGERWHDMILVESGTVDVLREPLKWIEETVIVTFGPRSFVGELGLLNGQRAFLTARVAEPGRMFRVDHEALQRMMADDDELCDLMLRALWARREELRRGPAAWTLKIIGSERSREAVALRRYAERLDLVHTWIDADDPEKAAAFANHGISMDDLPVAIVQGENLPRATPGSLRSCSASRTPPRMTPPSTSPSSAPDRPASPRRSTAHPRACRRCCSTRWRRAASPRRPRGSRTTSASRSA